MASKTQVPSTIKSKFSIYWTKKKKYRDWTYVYLSNDLTNSTQGANIGFDNSEHSTNSVVDRINFGSYLGKTMNKAIYNYRAYGQSVQSQLR